MSSKPIIRIQQLSKVYRVYNRPIDRVLESLLHRTGIRKSGTSFREIQALKPMDFDINPGETVGIIGQNGSGKSTLLQIISGTLYPTSGSVEVNGRLSALLELGAGFNPNFSGRENAYLNGSIMTISWSSPVLVILSTSLSKPIPVACLCGWHLPSQYIWTPIFL